MEYYARLTDFKTKILSYVETIFKCYGRELLLRLEDYNLLEHPNNCLQSSTAIGYVMEEFLVSKLETFTQNHVAPDYKICRDASVHSTTNASYDCFSWLEPSLFAMINLKMNKTGSANNAVAAIHRLYEDFVVKSPETPKCFLVLKIFYDFALSTRDRQRKIFVTNVSAYFLDEINLRENHRQDKRNWSAELNLNSGRLQISEKTLRENRLAPEEISYQNTCETLRAIVERNAKKAR